MEPMPRTFPIWRTLAAVLLAGVMVGVLLSLWPHQEPAPAPAPQPQPEQPARAPAPVHTEAPPARSGPPQPAAKMIRYPDGSQYPTLNGVKDPLVISWPVEIPFSPVVGQFKDEQGLEWYRHADGTRSTVQMMWRKDLGRMDTTGRVENPTRAVKIDDGETGGKKD